MTVPACLCLTRRLVLVALCGGTHAGTARAQDKPTMPPAVRILQGGRMLSEDGTTFLKDRALVFDQSIQSLPPAAGRLPVGEVLDTKGLYVIPGLIDLHTHLVLHPYEEVSWNDQVLHESAELRTIRGVRGARATVRAGFTTVRDLGTEGAGYADVALRDAIRQGWITGPEVVTSTLAIVASGCYGPFGFEPRTQALIPKGAQVADGVDGVRRAVRAQVSAGADWIKVYADYRRGPGEPSTPTFSLEELTALVQEATSAGRKVSAHASTPEGIRRAVLAGAATIEHGTGATREVLQLMQQHGVVLCPTLATAEAISRYQGWGPGKPEPLRMKQARMLMQMALEVGVTIACGSDAGVFPHGDNAREIELMVEYGMTPTDALAAATWLAADVLEDASRGRLRVGARADLVALAGNPLKDPAALRQVQLVIVGGEVILDRR